MSDTFDCVVLGGGIVGAACFSSLNRRGIRTLLIEHRRPAHGATGYSGAVVRVAHQDAASVSQAAAGLRAYHDLIRRSGNRVTFRQTGYLHFADEAALSQIRGQLQGHDIQAEMLGRRDLRTRFGDLLPEADAAIFEPASGYLDPHGATQALVEEGIAAGGMLWEGVRAGRPDMVGGRIGGLHTSAGSVETAAIVVALGGQSPGWLDDAGIAGHDLWNQQIQVTHFKGRSALPAVPCFIDDNLDINGRASPSTGGLYVGLPTHRHRASSETSDPASPEHMQRTAEVAARRFAWMRTATPAGALCHCDCYSTTPGGRIGRVPGGPKGLFLATGFSGGGFKMAPFAGERIAELVA